MQYRANLALRWVLLSALTITTALQAAPISPRCHTPQLERTLHDSLGHIDALGQKYGTHSTQVADAYYRLANFMSSHKCFREAIRYHKKALAIREEKLGPCHEDTVRSYREIGNLYRMIDDPESARYYHAKALKASQKAFCEVWGK